MISAELWELISFFEVEPTFPHPEDPWPYTVAIFTARPDGATVEFEIMPSYGDVAISIRRENEFEYEFSALQLSDVCCSNNGDGETLELQLSPNHSVFLRLRPSISIKHQRTGTRESQIGT